MSDGVAKCHTPESPSRAPEPCLPVLSQKGVPLKHGKLSTLALPLLHLWTGRYHTSPVDDSCFLTLTLCWIGRLHTNPIRSRVHTPPVPSGSAVLGEHLPRIRCRRRHELLLILKVLILLMEKLPLSELFLCPSWVCRQSLHLGRPIVGKEVDPVCHRLVLGAFLDHQNHSLNFHLLFGWYSSTLQGRRLRCGML